MASNVGDRLGHYDVAALIGEGGMGQVYQATDTKLNRQVALKILPEAFATDPDRLARFQREAQVLASLNHPGIAAIYGLEEAGDTRALVLELVEGPTLADRIKQGPIPIDEALPIAKQIAEALEAAHEAGVIHRDLKPANIKVREDGTVKVLDFGLAKALDTTPQGDPSQSPTLTAAATQMGVIMGTAAYMSPEQARGKPVDRRADIWPFGAVVYEMLTGQRAFEDEDVSLTLSAVLQREPAFDALPSNTPAALGTFLRRCLEKDPRRRVQAAGDLRLAVEGAFDTVARTPSEQPTPPTSPSWQRPLFTVAGTLMGAVLIGRLGLLVLRPAIDAELTRFAVELPGRNASFTSEIAISPDGRSLVYQANGQLYLRPLDQIEATPLPGTEDGRDAFFSPDSRSLAFFTDTQLKTMDLSEGTQVAIADLESRGLVGAWDAQGEIIFGMNGLASLFHVPDTGGTPEVFAELGDHVDFDYPDVLPGGEWVIFTALAKAGGWSDANILAQSVATGDRKLLVEGGHFARYVPTGHLVYARDGALVAVGFDSDSMAVTTPPVVLVTGIDAFEGGGVAQFAISDDGTLVYLPAKQGGSRHTTLALVSRDGSVRRLNAPPKDYRSPRVSPDGEKLVVESREEGGGVLWIYELTEETQIRQLTFEGNNTRPIWTPDSGRIIFSLNASFF